MTPDFRDDTLRVQQGAIQGRKGSVSTLEIA